MDGSFRRRLLTIAALTVLACGAAVLSILFLSRAAMDERTAHARDNVVREVERLKVVLAAVPRADRSKDERRSGDLQSGFVDVANAIATGDDALVADAVRQAANTTDVVVIERRDSEARPFLVAAARLPGGGTAFASQPVIVGRETRGLRVVVVLLALLSFGLVVASLRTLAAVERDVSTLRGSLASIAKDLRAPLARPALRELDEVSSGVVALAHDLDRANKERERLTRELADRERLAALGRVAAGIAHEVRNPLTSMKLRADLARASGEATPAIARDLEDIASEIGRLDRLVSDLLVVAGRRVGPREPLDVGALVERRISLLANWADAKQVELRRTGAARASVDGDALSRAIDNLLRNAVEASPPGSRVEVQVTEIDGAARVVVVDRGTGVPAERATELFEPFFTTKPDGTGLGLALARAVATAHDGTLTYDRDGERTRFTLTVARAIG